MALELQQVQSRLNKAKKDAHRLEKILAKSTVHNKAEAQAGSSRRSAPVSPAPDAILGDWVAEERPRTEGGERTWALSRKPSNGSACGRKETDTGVRSKSTPVGGRSAATATAAAGSKGLGSRPGDSCLICSFACTGVLSTRVVFEGRRALKGAVGISPASVVVGHRFIYPWPYVVGALRT